MTPTALPSHPRSEVRLATSLPAGLLTLAAAMTSPGALAQEPPFKRGESQWGIGLGVDVQREAYRDMGNDTQGIPLIYFENYWVRVMGPGVELKLPPAGPVSFRLKARYAMEGFEASDSPYLAGMAEREDGVWIGGQATWHTPFVNLSAELMGDASSNSEGRQFKLQADRRFVSGKFSFTPRLAAVHLDQEYVGYYYGVNASEAIPGRPQYEGDSTINMEVGLRIDYTLSPKQNVFLDLRSTRLGDGIKDSPLIDRSSQTGLRVGYLYRF
ncbi:MAG: MipA/OmpV family protein [Hydrogenophaga sp.]|nr:MipA/OmpV family protein [Hydrogenophaga sp.]